jgi:phage terminase small subunit
MPFNSVYRPPSVGTNNKGKELTAKMVGFVDLYMVHQNGTKAAELSAYKTDNPSRLARRLLAHPLIIAEIKRRTEIRSIKMEIKADYIVNKLTQIIDDAEEKTGDRLRAIELAGKTIGIFKERQEISGPDGEAIRTEQVTKENADAFSSRISGLAKRSGTSNVVSFPDGSGESGT